MAAKIDFFPHRVLTVWFPRNYINIWSSEKWVYRELVKVFNTTTSLFVLWYKITMYITNSRQHFSNKLWGCCDTQEADRQRLARVDDKREILQNCGQFTSIKHHGKIYEIHMRYEAEISWNTQFLERRHSFTGRNQLIGKVARKAWNTQIARTVI